MSAGAACLPAVRFARHGAADVAHCLLRAGAKLSTRNKAGLSPLDEALVNNAPEAATVLFQAKAALQPVRGCAAAFLFLFLFTFLFVFIFLYTYIPPGSAQSRSKLYEAVQSPTQPCEAVRSRTKPFTSVRLFESVRIGPVRIERARFERTLRYSALHLVAGLGHLSPLRLLLLHGADPADASTPAAFTPLHCAALAGQACTPLAPMIWS